MRGRPTFSLQKRRHRVRGSRGLTRDIRHCTLLVHCVSLLNRKYFAARRGDASTMASKPVKNTPRYYLISTAGHPNYGDELIVLAWLSYLSERAHGAEVWLDYPNPGRASVLFANAHPNLHVTNTLWELVWSIDTSLSFRDAAQVARDKATHLGTPKQDLGLALIGSMDSVHFLGGGYVNSIWPVNALVPIAATALRSKNPGIRLFGTGLGLTPETPEISAELSAIFPTWEFVEVRDRESAAITGTTYGLDDAFLALRHGSARNKPAAFRIDPAPGPQALLLIQGDFASEAERLQALDIAFETLDERFPGDKPALGVLEAIPPDDAWLLEQVRTRWQGEVRFFPFAHLWMHGLPFRGAEILVSTRFHFHLLAAASGISGLAIGVRPEYYDVKHHSLIERGTGWSYAEMTAPASHFSATVSHDFPAHAREFSLQKTALADRLYPATKASRPSLLLQRNRSSK